MSITYKQVIARLDQMHDYGHYAAALCPFHDDHNPSLMVNTGGWFYCKTCGASGRFEDLWRRLQGWSSTRPVSAPTSFATPYLPSDLRELEIIVEDAHDMLSQYLDSLGWYLQMRGVCGRVEACHLGWYKGWYTIPCFTKEVNRIHQRALQGVIARASPHIQEASGVRFHQPKGQKPIMYCPDWQLLENAEYLVIVFGMFDALTLAELRVPVVTTTAGQDSFNPDWLSWWRKRIIVIPDKGEEVQGVKLAGAFGWRSRLLRLEFPEGCKDPADFHQHKQTEYLLNQIRSAT
jgi:hypothetical protein